MKKSKKLSLLLIGLFTIALLFPIAVGAYSKSYTFEIAHKVDGKTKYTLANKSTSTTAKGQTYNSAGTVHSTKSAFAVDLNGSWFTRYMTSDITANNRSYTRSFGTVKSGDYTMSVRKTVKGDYADYIKGSGTLNQ